MDGIFLPLRIGTPRRDLPKDYGPHSTCHNRYNRWSGKGLWEKIPADFQKPVGESAGRGDDGDGDGGGAQPVRSRMIDSSTVRVHRHAAGSRRDSGPRGMGRSRGGLTTKIHAMVDEGGRPRRMHLSPGQASDCGGAAALPGGLRRAHSRSPTGRMTRIPSLNGWRPPAARWRSRPNRTAGFSGHSTRWPMQGAMQSSVSSGESKSSEGSPHATTSSRVTISPRSYSPPPGSCCGILPSQRLGTEPSTTVAVPLYRFCMFPDTGFFCSGDGQWRLHRLGRHWISGLPRCGTPGADPSPVQAGADVGPGGTFSGRFAWRRAAQSRLDAGRGGRGSGAVAAAGDSRAGAPGRRCAARPRAGAVPGTLADADATPVLDETGFPKRAGCRAAWRGSARDRRAGPPIAGRAFSPSASRATATPSSTGGCTCRRRGRTIRRAWPVRMCRTAPGSPPSRPSRFRWSGGPPGRMFRFAGSPQTASVVLRPWEKTRQAGKGCVPGVGADHRFASWGKPQAVAGTAARIAGDLPEEAWRRLSAGDGTKGERLYDWACIELADPGIAGTWTRGLPGRRTVAEGDPAFFPHGVPPARTSGNSSRWRGAAGRRGVFPERQNRARPRPHRDTVVAWLAPSCFPGYARLCDDGHDPVPRQRDATAKKHPGQAPDPAPDPVVDAGNPPRLNPTRAKADTPGACHRVVTLATGPPGRRTGIPSQSRSQL